jgi:cyclase
MCWRPVGFDDKNGRMTHAISRRELLRTAGAGTAAALLWPAVSPLDRLWAQADRLAEARANIGKAPVATLKLTNSLAMLSGPGGNVIVLNGPDGKFVVDTFVQPAWGNLKAALDAMGNAPIKAAIDTHWHYDHADNNASFRQAGAEIVAHDNTKKRLMETHSLLGMTFTPVPPAALPTQTFASAHTITANGEGIELVYIPPAHTDSDIAVRFMKGNVIHLGDVFFNGMYPFIDQGTGGSINGMIRGADQALKLIANDTRVVPGHGPLGDRAAFVRYRDMLVTVRDRVQKLKTSGRPLEDAIAAKPTKDLDAVWGKGFMPPDNFVTIVYSTL